MIPQLIDTHAWVKFFMTNHNQRRKSKIFKKLFGHASLFEFPVFSTYLTAENICKPRSLIRKYSGDTEAHPSPDNFTEMYPIIKLTTKFSRVPHDHQLWYDKTYAS